MAVIPFGPNHRGGMIHATAGMTRDERAVALVRKQARKAARAKGVVRDFEFLFFECGPFDFTCPYGGDAHSHAFWRGLVA